MFDIYFAGDYLFPYNGKTIVDIYLLNYNRLLSYDYQRKLVDKLIERIKNVELYLAGTDKFGKDERGDILDLYFAGAADETTRTVDAILPSNLLFSYENQQTRKSKDFGTYHGTGAKLFIDSGAFSMWTKGATINVDEYIQWINERSEYIELYGQVDVIPGDRNSGKLPTPEQVREAAQKTWENYLYMRPKMNKPEGLLYTFHVGEPIEFLKRALEWTDENGNHIPYIALGGMVGKSADVRDRFLNACFHAIQNSSNPHVKVHAFGMTDRDLLMKYPITSADSTSWIMIGAMGNIMTDVGTVTVSQQQSNLPTHYSHLPKEALEAFNKSISEFGFTLEELGADRNKRLIHNARYMKKKCAEIEYKPIAKKKRLF